MPSIKSDARWRDAVTLTAALWLFVVLIFLPGIISRHSGGGWFSVLLDSSTILFSMFLGLVIFAIFRATIDWPSQARLVILGLSVLGAAIANAIFDLAFFSWVAENVETSWLSKLQTELNRSYDKAFRYLLVFCVNLALLQLSFGRRRSSSQERQLADARSAAQQAQLQALRYQLNPHFLFNTLNSISSLIVTRRNEDAEQMTNKLSSFLRSSLTCDPGGLIRLEEELALIEEYLDIEAVRFGERLNVEIDCSCEAGCALIPGFLVQPLVENAIKHGVAPSREPVTIRICAWLEEGQLCVTVENCVPSGEIAPTIGAGVGLANVKQRLQAVFGEAASLSTENKDRTYVATICIPGVRSTC
jgi:sensor histidine kinase YesM